MAAVNSTMLPLGTQAPDFTLVEPRTGKMVSSDDFRDAKGLLVMFICNHCPYVKLIKGELVRYSEEYEDKGIAVVAINSNDAAAYPQDSPEEMVRDAEQFQYPFPYLYDETQEVAKRYKAACTPDLFLFDGSRKLYYRGQFDSSRPRNEIIPTGEDLRNATDRLLEGEPAPVDQIPSIGCNIKWKKGNEPSYFG